MHAPSPIRFEIDLPPQVAAGEPVPITLRAKNTGPEPIDLYLRGREIAFDITVTREDGEIVWRRLEGRTVPAILQVRTLSPGEWLELREVWDQQSNGGRPAVPGLYTVEGTFPTDLRQPAKTPAAPLRIVPVG
jgi:intracellular proteinase inhibitor BsuPI